MQNTISERDNNTKRSDIRYNQDPDFNIPLLEISAEARGRILGRLRFLYGDDDAEKWMPELERILKVHYAHKPQELIDLDKDYDPTNRFSEKDNILITYGDLVSGEGHSPLAALGEFLKRTRLSEVFSTLHILPFFPYSSDKGFSVTDYRAVDPNLGSWQEIDQMQRHYRLMFDGVFNHISSKSPAFQAFLQGDPLYEDIVTSYASPDALTQEQRKIIVRPRTSDILTRFQSINGPVWVWTTFSPDQIDINFKNPVVLLYVIETLLMYARRGANLVRLDAATYLWSEPGTPSVNLPQTHEVIKLFRDILDIVDPHVTLITETNVPHKDNISYFGNGYDEAQMVYNFALPPLVLHTFFRQDATALSEWAKELALPSKATTFFNFLDSHDGVGLLGARDILAQEDIDFIIQRARENGAFISYRTGKDGKDEPYEINTTWFSALNQETSDEEIAFKVKRFVASRSIALVLKGVPAIYFHGLLGIANDIDAVIKTKSKRDINRSVVHERELFAEADKPNSNLSHIVDQLGRILEIRVRQSAFHPNGEQRVLMISPSVFANLRTSRDGNEHILAVTNVTDRGCRLKIPLSEVGVEEIQWYDLVGRRGWMAKDKNIDVTLLPYDVAWLIPVAELERAIKS